MNCLHLFTSTTETPLGNGRRLIQVVCNGCGEVLVSYEG